MMYSFEGNARRRPEQNLSGASKKESRDVLLKRAHQERRKREEQRHKLQSALIIQSHVRSYLIRKQKKSEERLSFDNYLKCDNIESLRVSLGKLLFFFNTQQDLNRLLKLCQKLLAFKTEVLKVIDNDSRFNWCIRRMLALCLRVVKRAEATELCLNSINTFTSLADSRERILLWPYLVQKGYFMQLRNLLIKDDSERFKCVLDLIKKPFLLFHLFISQTQKDTILKEFCMNFMYQNLEEVHLNNMIPHLLNDKFPFEELLRYLNEYVVEPNNDLLFWILALQPKTFEPTVESIQVFALLTKDLHSMSTVIDLTADSDSDEMEVCAGCITLNDFTTNFNNQERVKKIINFFDRNTDNEQLVLNLTKLCHNLLLVYKEAIHKFMLVYLLSLRGNFLHKLWHSIERQHLEETQVLQYSNSTGSWSSAHTTIAVFSNMFILYSGTLTDTDTSNTFGVFSLEELSNISELLKNISLNLIEIAYPMCRSNMIHSTPELQHLYKSCLDALQVLYMLDLRKHFCENNFWTSKQVFISPYISKRNYLTKTLKPFHGVVNEEEDDYSPPLITTEQRSLAVLQELPFLVDFNSRVLILRDLCRSSLSSGSQNLVFNQREFIADNAIVIRRNYLYEDSFEKLSPENEPDLKQKLRIQFVNNAGLDEPGIDGGGIFKEFINEVLKTAFDPNRGFFLLTNDNLLYPNPNVHLIIEDYVRHYYFIGRLVGKALFENILVDLPLAEFFLEKLLVEKVDVYHLRSLDPVLYRNLLYLQNYAGDVQDWGLDFTTASNDLGETRVIELKYNGRNIPVTSYNKLEYIHLLADFKLNKQIKRQCAAFRNGLNSVIPLLWLKLFNHRELQIIVGGDTQEMDINDLKNHTAYGGEFTIEHPTIINFWNIVESFTDTQKKMLLKFVTSCSRPPLLGFKELSPSFCIQSAGSDDRMPTASTCLNLLKLPVIRQESVLRDKLLQAIEQQAGFELS